MEKSICKYGFFALRNDIKILAGTVFISITLEVSHIWQATVASVHQGSNRFDQHRHQHKILRQI